MSTSLPNPGEQRQPALPVKRILIIRFGGIGDILMTTPTLRAVRAHYPDAAIDYLVSGGFQEVIHGHSAIRTVHEFYKQGRDLWPHRFSAFLWRLRAAKYDLVINLQPSVKTTLITWAAAARQTLIFRKDQAVQPGTKRRRHAINDFYETIRCLGVGALEDRSLDFHVPSASRSSVQKLLVEHGCSPGMRLILMHPAANHRVNRWPVSHFAALCEDLAARRDTFVVLTGHVKDKDLGRAVTSSLRRSERRVDLTGRLSLKELGALLELADVFVTGDTGPMHLASAVATPIVSLFGAADPDRTRPLSLHSRVLADQTLSCIPCHTRRCRYGKEARCLQMLLPRTVLTAVDQSARHSPQTDHLHPEAVKQR